jgi:HEAT repeat protein
MLHTFAAAIPALLLGFQDPTPTTQPTQDPTPAVAAQTAAPEAQPTNDAQNDKNLAAIALQRAEKTGPVADSLADVTALVQHADEAIAARATWLLGEWKSKEAIPALGQILSQHKSADLRLQAAASLDRIRDDDSSNALLDACNDADISVRAFAIQSLARRKAVGTERQAIALLERRAGAKTDDGSKDIVAALLAICDLGCADHILPAAAAVRFSTKETSEALVFLFQELSPKMEPQIEATALVATLDHNDPLLRRYAIQRLGELRDPATARALEGKLATEDPALQPLLRVSLAQVRRDKVETSADLALRAKSNAIAIGRLVERQWSSMDNGTRLSASAGAAVVSFGVLLILIARRRTRRVEAAREALALVSPSATLAKSRPDFPLKPRFEQAAEDRTPVGSGR